MSAHFKHVDHKMVVVRVASRFFPIHIRRQIPVSQGQSMIQLLTQPVHFKASTPFRLIATDICMTD